MNTRTFDRYSRLSAIICLTVFLAACGGGGATKTATAEWTWMSGNYTRNLNGVYGTQGVAAAGNVPGARDGSVSWTDSGGNFWLFGGFGYDSTGTYDGFNDLWEYSPANGEWTWMSGGNTKGAGGVYGTRGVAAAANVPGARRSSVSWIDSGGNFWLFGGFGYDSTGAGGDLNDLWKFNPTNKEWTWMSGSKDQGASSVYGTLGVAAAGNVPGMREYSISWTDGGGNFWLFGGENSTGDGNYFNDLWEFNPATMEWTWMSGSTNQGASGVYGTQGVAAAGNVPGARYAPASWMDSGGNLWLFGGYGYDSTGVTGQNQLNDLWEFSPATKEWTWVSGSNIWGAIGDYKALQTNFPGARDSSISWIDGGGNLWLFGGFGYDSYGASGDLNDLWVFNPTTKEWTWISGSNAGDDIGFYGTQGAAAATSFPGARNGSVSWIDKSGNLWLFGGIGYDSTGAAGDLNDLWLYRP